MGETLLTVDDLTITYCTDDGDLTAVSDASFEIEAGEFFGLAGESGSGKSTIAKAILGGLDDNGSVASGRISYDGQPLHAMSEAELNEQIRWKEISYIPQSSMNSLDPLQRLSDKAVEIADFHTDLSREAALERFRETFGIVGLQPDRITDYPHQFSGGMQQRAIIALALFLRPSLIIADEPTTALDVIMQDQIFKYIDEIRAETDTALLLISHDISLMFESCDSIAIMHAGQVTESGPVREVYDSPHHPYSAMLQRAFPDIRHPNRDLEIIEGYPPQNMGEVEYCTFKERCPWAEDECTKDSPPLTSVDGSDSHRAACFRADEIQEELVNDD